LDPDEIPCYKESHGPVAHKLAHSEPHSPLAIRNESLTCTFTLPRLDSNQ